MRYTIERAEHNEGRGWQFVARCGIDSFKLLADSLRKNGQKCRVRDNDLGTIVYTTP